jgi:hypothetical protein
LFHNLVLDDFCPWEDVDIGQGVIVRHMMFPACAVHNIHLSALATVTYLFHQQTKDVRKQLNFLLLLATLLATTNSSTSE